MSEEEQKTYENEVSKPAHGGKREGAGRPLGSKSKKPWKGMIELAEKYNLSPLDYISLELKGIKVLLPNPSRIGKYFGIIKESTYWKKFWNPLLLVLSE